MCVCFSCHVCGDQSAPEPRCHQALCYSPPVQQILPQYVIQAEQQLRGLYSVHDTLKNGDVFIYVVQSFLQLSDGVFFICGLLREVRHWEFVKKCWIYWINFVEKYYPKHTMYQVCKCVIIHCIIKKPTLKAWFIFVQ